MGSRKGRPGRDVGGAKAIGSARAQPLQALAHEQREGGLQREVGRGEVEAEIDEFHFAVDEREREVRFARPEQALQPVDLRRSTD